MGHYVYRYVENTTGEILYVGKNDTNLINRIKQHIPEKKFKDINAHVEYIELDSSLMSRFLEFYYINKWKPKLNDAAKYESEMTATLDEEKYKWARFEERDFEDAAKGTKTTSKIRKKRPSKQEMEEQDAKIEYVFPKMTKPERDLYFMAVDWFLNTGNRSIEIRDNIDTKEGKRESEFLESVWNELCFDTNEENGNGYGPKMFGSAFGVKDGNNYLMTGVKLNTYFFKDEEIRVYEMVGWEMPREQRKYAIDYNERERYKKLVHLIKSELEKWKKENNIMSQWFCGCTDDCE